MDVTDTSMATARVPVMSDEDERLQLAFITNQPTWLDRDPNSLYLVVGFTVELSAWIEYDVYTLTRV